MSLATNLQNAFTRVGTEFKTVYSRLGSLAALTTTDKSTLVAAVNEVKASIGSAGATINDTTPSGSTVYSSTKTNSAIATAVSALVASAPTALDTLDELAAALGDDANFATTVTTALGNRVRFDAAQTLTAPQKVQVNANIGSLSLIDSGDPATDFTATFVTALS